jgi:hypothetical protein
LTTDKFKPKVLVTSIDSWSKLVGADYLSSLFDGYDIDKLANIYIRDEIPTSTVCRKYFRISENLIIKSILHRTISTGKAYNDDVITHDNIDIQNLREHNERYRKMKNKKSSFMFLVRELIWLMGKWRSPELDAFIDDFKPDIVMFALEGYIHFNRLNRYVLKRTHAKGFGFFWDDNFSFVNGWKGFWPTLYRLLQRIDIMKTIQYCNGYFANTTFTKQICDTSFGINCTVITKPARLRSNEWVKYEIKKPIRMLYTGNFNICRFSSIQVLVNAMRKINKLEILFDLTIYTTSFLQKFEKDSIKELYVHINGAIPQSEVHFLQSKADILIYVEDILGGCKNSSRLSFSTKLPDYFGAGKCIFAIGTYNTSPINYLKEKDAAILSISEQQVYDNLLQILKDPNIVLNYAKKAFECGLKNHSKTDMQKRMVEAFNASL